MIRVHKTVIKPILMNDCEAKKNLTENPNQKEEGRWRVIKNLDIEHLTFIVGEYKATRLKVAGRGSCCEKSVIETTERTPTGWTS